MHEDRQDNGARDAGETDVHGVQVNGGPDRHVAAVRVIVLRGVARQSGYYAHRRRLVGMHHLELLESAIGNRQEKASEEFANRFGKARRF